MSGDVTPEREALADWLGGQVESHNVTDYTDEATTWIEVVVDDLTDRLLASDWLAAHDARVKREAAAEAWDEGATAASKGKPGERWRDNPYREEAR